MKAKSININQNTIMEKIYIQIKVKGIPRYKLKLILATNLIKLASWIMGCKFEISINEN